MSWELLRVGQIDCLLFCGDYQRSREGDYGWRNKRRESVRESARHTILDHSSTKTKTGRVPSGTWKRRRDPTKKLGWTIRTYNLFTGVPLYETDKKPQTDAIFSMC